MMSKALKNSPFKKEIAEVWKLFKESERERKEQKKEMDRWRREAEREKRAADREMREADRKRQKELDREMREADRRFKKMEGFFTCQWGRLVEALAEESLKNVMEDAGVYITSTYPNRKCVYGSRRTEFDIIGSNGHEVVVVEVKTTLRPSGVRHFLDRVKDFKHFCREFKPFKVYGAVAYLRAVKEADSLAEQKGLFVIRAAGKSAVLKNAKNFKPREFDI